jgi:hypothetical protein
MPTHSRLPGHPDISRAKLKFPPVELTPEQMVHAEAEGPAVRDQG